MSFEKVTTTESLRTGSEGNTISLLSEEHREKIARLKNKNK
jgi:hypothetical protein